jgi:Leucine rich repeat
LLIVAATAQQNTIECEFETYEWLWIAKFYTCKTKTLPGVLNKNTHVTGTHESGKNDGEVEWLRCDSTTCGMTKFPHGLEKIFGNLRGVQFFAVGLSELHKEDLIPYTNLEHLLLHYNELTVLEENLFSGNPNLRTIYLPFNKIKVIHPTAFDNLTKLRHLNLHGNVCIDVNAVNDRDQIKELIDRVKDECKSE